LSERADVKTRFKTGNKGGPGNPYAKAREQAMKLLFQTIDAEKQVFLINCLLQNAAKGDTKAAIYLLDRVLPKEDTHIELNLNDVKEELIKRIWNFAPTMSEDDGSE
jgi:hypothetical protein